MKSPLRDNVDFRCASFLRKKIPRGSIIHSFLMYGGGLELSLAKGANFVAAHTIKYAVYEFWVCALHDAARVAAIAESLHPVEDNHIFEVYQRSWGDYEDHFIRSGIFFLLNRCSDDGRVSCGTLHNENFTPHALLHLQGFESKNLHMVHDEAEDYLSAVGAVGEADVLLFPVGKYSLNLFEEGKSRGPEMTSVNHRSLKDTLDAVERKWVVVYKYHPHVLSEYKDYNVTMISKYGQPTQRADMCEDIVIANF